MVTSGVLNPKATLSGGGGGGASESTSNTYGMLPVDRYKVWDSRKLYEGFHAKKICMIETVHLYTRVLARSSTCKRYQSTTAAEREKNNRAIYTASVVCGENLTKKM